MENLFYFTFREAGLRKNGRTRDKKYVALEDTGDGFWFANDDNIFDYEVKHNVAFAGFVQDIEMPFDEFAVQAMIDDCQLVMKQSKMLSDQFAELTKKVSDLELLIGAMNTKKKVA